MWNPLREGLFFHLRVDNYYDLTMFAAFSIGLVFLVSKAWKDISCGKGEIPGRLGLPFLGETFSFLSATNSTKGCYNFVRHRRLLHGKWFKTRIFGQTHVFVPSTEGAKMIFANDFSQFNKGFVKSMEECIGKKSLLCVSKVSHKRIRRLLSYPLSMNSLSKFVKRFDKLVYERLEKETGKSFTVLDFCTKVQFDAMCDMLMSVTDASLLQQIERDCIDISKAMLSFPFMIIGTKYYKGIKARERLMQKFSEMIRRRRKEEESHDDFLQSMLQRDSLEEKLEDSEIMDNMLTLIITGQTTTAAAMMWSVKFLDENSEVQDILRSIQAMSVTLKIVPIYKDKGKFRINLEEQLSIARNKPKGASLTLEDVNSMSYGSKVVKETLRMSNVVVWFPRVALNDCTIEGFQIKKGWHVNIDSTCIHGDPFLYKNPMQFDPSRFDEIQKPFSFIPFGAGPRTCLGINMAKLAMLVFLHRLTSGYKWSVNDQDPSLEKKAHIPRLGSGCPITLIPI